LRSFSTPATTALEEVAYVDRSAVALGINDSHIRWKLYTSVKTNERYNYLQLEMRSVERGICPIGTSTMNELFQ